MNLRTHPALLHLLIIGTVIAAVAGLRRISQIQAVAPLVAGGIYSIEYGSAFGIVKILALTPGAVHVRLFQQSYWDRPNYVDLSTLTLGPHDDPAGFSIGHMPITRQAFENSVPRLIAQVSVEEEELEGFRLWEEAEGGLFNSL